MQCSELIHIIYIMILEFKIRPKLKYEDLFKIRLLEKRFLQGSHKYINLASTYDRPRDVNNPKKY